MKLWGCSTEVLLISGRSLAANLGWVALQRAEFSLADRAAGFARSAWRDAELLLAARAAFLLLLLLDFWQLGGWEEAPEGGIKKLPLLGDEMQAARGQRPNLPDFRRMVG